MSTTIKRWSFSIVLALFLLSTAITFVIFFEPLFRGVILLFGLEQYSGISTAKLMENYHVLISYLTRPWIKELVMPDFPSTPQGLFHFEEVKRLFMINFVIAVISTIVSFVGIKGFKKERKLFLLLTPLKGILYATLLFVVCLVSFFDVIFVKFHELFFHNSAWIFDPKLDPIIEVLPEEFFMICFLIVFLWLIFGIMGIRRWIRKQEQM